MSSGCHSEPPFVGPLLAAAPFSLTALGTGLQAFCTGSSPLCDQSPVVPWCGRELHVSFPQTSPFLCSEDHSEARSQRGARMWQSGLSSPPSPGLGCMSAFHQIKYGSHWKAEFTTEGGSNPSSATSQLCDPGGYFSTFLPNFSSSFSSSFSSFSSSFHLFLLHKMRIIILLLKV